MDDGRDAHDTEMEADGLQAGEGGGEEDDGVSRDGSGLTRCTL